MKKTYMIPTFKVVEIRPASILEGSAPQLRGETNATSGNLGRNAHFSDWEEEADYGE